METEEQVVFCAPEEYKALIDYKEAVLCLGYQGAEPDEDTAKELRECERELLLAMEPRCIFRNVRIIREKDTAFFGVRFEEETLKLPGEAIQKHLGQEDFAIAACLTLGKRVDELVERLQTESMLMALLTDALANAAVEKLREKLEKKAEEIFGRQTGWLFGIGYDDLCLSLQKDFLRCMHAERIGLSANDQMILSPLKSVTGFLNFVPQNAQKAGKVRCSGRCGMCEKREECRFFGGKN